MTEVAQPYCTFLICYGCNSSLLTGGGINCTTNATNSEVKTKYTFTMPKESFKNIKPFFKFNRKIVMREIFYSLDLMKDNIWIKEVIEFDGDWNEDIKYYDIKVVDNILEVNGLRELKYKQHKFNKIEDLKNHYNTLKTSNDFENMFAHPQYSFDIVRKTYNHNDNSEAKLTVDKVYFENGETFMVFSFEGVVPEDNNKNDLSPCRSKIIELLLKTEDTKATCEMLLENEGSHRLPYVSMSIMEYKLGKEEYEKRNVAAETFIKELVDAGETDKRYLAFMKRQAVTNGITESNYSEEDY